LTTPFPATTDRVDFNVRYRTVASNGIGYGIESPDLLVVTDTYPRKMNSVTIDGEIQPQSIKINWSLLTTSDADTGRDPILNYQLDWMKDGTSTWVPLVTGDASLSTLTVTSGFDINTKYYIRVSAINTVGMG